jgi:hypothetical protein
MNQTLEHVAVGAWDASQRALARSRAGLDPGDFEIVKLFHLTTCGVPSIENIATSALRLLHHELDPGDMPSDTEPA